jgi:hypothetical protein
MYFMIPSALQEHGKEFAGTAASLLSAANSRRRLPRLPEPTGGEKCINTPAHFIGKARLQTRLNCFIRYMRQIL